MKGDCVLAELGVEHWRFEQLVAAGWPEQQALVLAANDDVNLHVACDLLPKGCDLRLALQILL
jgi:hypothetical protein